MDLACSFTAGKDVKPSAKDLYRAEHSPIRTQLFWVEMKDIPTYVSVHFCRHHVGVTHFVQSNRKTTAIVTRETPVDHAMLINAQALINMSRKRLCGKADYTTQTIMWRIKDMVDLADPDLAEFMIPECKYRGHCPEMKGCGKK